MDFSEYTANRKTAIAYGLYYFPQTFARVHYILNELHQGRGWLGSEDAGGDDGGSFEILDLGSGVGGAAFSAVTYLSEILSRKVRVQAVDQSKTKLDLLTKLAGAEKGLWPQAQFSTRRGDLNRHEAIKHPKGKGWDLILASFSLGEAFYEDDPEQAKVWLTEVCDYLSDDGVMVIVEPALRETSIRLEFLRDHVAGETPYHVWAPCLHEEACPLKPHPKAKRWCHEVRHWRVPETANAINQRMQRPRSIGMLKFSFLVVGKKASPVRFDSEERAFRLISPLKETAGKFQMTGCSACGEICDYDLLTRGMKIRDKKELLGQVARGDLIQAEALKPLGGDRNYRVDRADFNIHHSASA